jgi:hypothetical protein
MGFLLFRLVTVFLLVQMDAALSEKELATGLKIGYY